jgi:hypothetical protein
LRATRASTSAGYARVFSATEPPADPPTQAAIEAGEDLSKRQALALAGANVEKLLGARPSRDLVATIGGDLLDLGAKVAGVISVERGVVDLV